MQAWLAAWLALYGLDSTLYREAASPGSGVWQAAAVIVIMAAISQIRWGTARFVDLVRSDTDGMDIGAAIAQTSIPSAVVTGLAYLAAWPVWAAGFWIVGTLWATASRPPPRFGHVARALRIRASAGFLGRAVRSPSRDRWIRWEALRGSAPASYC